MASQYVVTGTLQRTQRLMMPYFETVLNELYLGDPSIKVMGVSLGRDSGVLMQAALVGLTSTEMVLMLDTSKISDGNNVRYDLQSMWYNQISSVVTHKSHLFWWGVDVTGRTIYDEVRTFKFVEMERDQCIQLATFLRRMKDV